MTLTMRSRLGPYEILEPIGAGGMGEVYRAKDPRLRREVAIKVLPASFSTDPDRLNKRNLTDDIAASTMPASQADDLASPASVLLVFRLRNGAAPRTVSETVSELPSSDRLLERRGLRPD